MTPFYIALKFTEHQLAMWGDGNLHSGVLAMCRRQKLPKMDLCFSGGRKDSHKQSFGVKSFH